ncbi:MAG: trypsin-like peptidase domain-containing protein [Oscillospiraceae bacterium]|nr:trypsin-like peptidase domain-containing protein [Oscillospiraceae bacterium]
MDNNFDKNNNGEDSTFSGNPGQENMSQGSSQQDNIPVQEHRQEFPHQESIPVQDFRQPFMQGQNGMPEQYGMPYYGNNIGTYPSPVKEPKKRRLSNEWLCALISVIAAMFVIVVVLAAAIAVTNKKTRGNIDYQNVTITKVENNPVEHVSIEIPKSEKPVLEEEMYQNKETGLLTTVGVAKVILPSQVKIKVYDEVPYSAMAYGSGVILTRDGYILTNAHVVDGAVQVAVVFYDGSESVATIVGVDNKTDLAVVHVDRDDLSPAEIGTSSSIVIGEEIAVAGAGGGFENTVTYGHVTGLERRIDTEYMSSSVVQCIQTDAAVNPGNSGGALVNMYGQVIGIAVLHNEKYERVGFSIAIDDAVPIAEELIAQGYVTSRTKVGISYIAIGDANAEAYGIMPGLCVMEIDPTSDAVNADLKPYDIITEIDGKRVFDMEEISDALAGKLPGDTITLTVFRKNITDDVSVFKTQVKLSQDMSAASARSASLTERNNIDIEPDE